MDSVRYSPVVFVSSVEGDEDYHVINELSPLTSFCSGRGDFKERYGMRHRPVWRHNSETPRKFRTKERYGMDSDHGGYAYGGGGYHCVWFEKMQIMRSFGNII